MNFILPPLSCVEHNFEVQLKSAARWCVFVNTLQAQNNALLKNILTKRFSHHRFDFKRLEGRSLLGTISKTQWDGIIADLKTLSDRSLPLLDKMMKAFRQTPFIMVVNPVGFQLLQKRRPKYLDRPMILLSETKSLDYLLHLPRFIDEVGRKKRLKAQNERLQRLAAQRLPQLSETSIADSLRADENTKTWRCGLKIQFRDWSRLKRSVGETGLTEIASTISRVIQTSVRNSDRVLHANEDEFLIFLSHAESSQLKRCQERLSQSLKTFDITANQRNIKLPFTITPLERLSYLAN